jgi:uncharacterized membrane protein YfcA
LPEFLDPLFVLCGFGVGFLVGLTGVGGGSLMTPALIFLFGVHPSAAVGTDLLYASGTKLAGTAIHSLHRDVDWPLVGRLALGSLPGAAVGMAGLIWLGAASPAANALITHSLGVALGATAIAVLLRRQILSRYGTRLSGLDKRTIHRLTTLMGAVVGILVSLSSVGAGALGVTALLLLYPAMPTARIVGSDIAHAVPLTLLAGISHLAMGQTDLGMLASLLVGSVPAVVLAGTLAPRVPDKALRYALSGVLLLVAIRLLA